MKILFITLFPLEDNTSVSKSNYGLLNGLKENGHEITILMPFPNKNASYYDEHFDVSGCKIVRFGSKNVGSSISSAVQSKKSKLFRSLFMVARHIFNYFSLFGRTSLYEKEIDRIEGIESEYDIVISTSDPKSTHRFTEKFLRKKKVLFKKWIQHWGDPLFGDITFRKVWPSWYVKKQEHKLISKADLVAFVSPFTANDKKSLYADLCSKIFFVPLPAIDHIPENVHKCSSGTLNISYLGDYNSKVRNITHLYNVCKKEKLFSLTIAGNTDLSLEAEENIKILPRISGERVAGIEQDSDVIFCVCNLTGTQIPGKLYYSASTNKHIVVAIEHEQFGLLSEYLERYFPGRFIFCENNEPSILGALKACASKETDYQTPEKLTAKYVTKALLEGKYE